MPITPGRKRATASTIAIAATSPPFNTFSGVVALKAPQFKGGEFAGAQAGSAGKTAAVSGVCGQLYYAVRWIPDFWAAPFGQGSRWGLRQLEVGAHKQKFGARAFLLLIQRVIRSIMGSRLLYYR